MAHQKHFSEDEDKILVAHYTECGADGHRLCSWVTGRTPAGISQHMKSEKFKALLKAASTFPFNKAYELDIQEIMPQEEKKMSFVNALVGKPAFPKTEEDVSSEDIEEKEEEMLSSLYATNQIISYCLGLEMSKML